jgi:hypothetical protein
VSEYVRFAQYKLGKRAVRRQPELQARVEREHNLNLDASLLAGDRITDYAHARRHETVWLFSPSVVK